MRMVSALLWLYRQEERQCMRTVVGWSGGAVRKGMLFLSIILHADVQFMMTLVCG